MPNNNQHLRSEEVQDILTKVPHWMILWGNTLILGLLVLFFIFTWYIKYPDVISTEATITSQTPPQKIYAPYSGKIDTLLVQNNQLVRGGEIIGMIQNTAKLKDVLFLKAILDTVNIRGEVFEFPADKIPLLSLGEVASDYAIFEKEYIEYTLNKSLNPYGNKQYSNNLSKNEIRSRLENLKNQKELDTKKHQLAENEFNRNKQLFEKGVISQNEFENKQTQFLESERNLKNIDNSFSQLNQSLNDAFQNSRDNKINNQIDETRLFKNLIQSFTQLKQRIDNWELNYLLRADVDGKISFLNIWNTNQNVTKGDLLFTVVPNQNTNYLAKINAPIRNSGKIIPGQKVNIKLLNYPETEFGMLNGTVKSMSAIPNEEGFYLVNVALNDKLITSYNIEISFINEMTGTAEIITEDLRLLERFFYQLRGIFS